MARDVALGRQVAMMTENELQQQVLVSLARPGISPPAVLLRGHGLQRFPRSGHAASTQATNSARCQRTDPPMRTGAGHRPAALSRCQLARDRPHKAAACGAESKRGSRRRLAAGCWFMPALSPWKKFPMARGNFFRPRRLRWTGCSITACPFGAGNLQYPGPLNLGRLSLMSRSRRRIGGRQS